MDERIFSIIIPTYNRKKQIQKTISSVFDQTFGHWELIIVDDGSTDGTSELISAKYGSEVQLISISNGERGRARNRGAQIARGRYIYFLDSDDKLYPCHLEVALEFIRSKDNPEWFFQEYEFIEAGSSRSIPVRYNRKKPVESLVKKGNFISCHGVFLRNDIAKKHPFNENRAMAGSEDYALWLELAARYTLHTNPIITSALVQHPDRSVFNYSSEDLVRRKEFMLRHVLSDSTLANCFRAWLSTLKSNTYSYLALHLAMVGEKQKAYYYFKESIKAYPGSILNRRAIAIFKHMFI